jgi:hypothetical protein
LHSIGESDIYRVYNSKIRNIAIEIAKRDIHFMSFDEEDITNKTSKKENDKPKTFFGFEIGDSLTYGVVIVLTIIFIYQAAGIVAVL